MYKGKTFIISGPSGVGKSTVLKELFEDRDDLYFSVSATTRTPRPGEVDGVHYHFTDVDEFRKMISEDAFLEYAEYVGNFYGTPKRFVDEAMEQGKDVILDIEVQGALQVKKIYPEGVLIFEHSKKMDFSAYPEFWQQRSYGSVQFSFFRKP